MSNFSGLKLAQPLLRALSDEGYSTPTPIQLKSIPPLLDGRDLLGVAQTGTGKTAAFSLPLLHRLAERPSRAQSHHPRALILAPTRELASQIADSVRTYGRHVGLRTTVVFGGTSIRPQIKAMARGVHILVATPGRLLDLMNQGQVRLDRVEVFILDEADRMLDMGFIRDVRKISSKMPKHRQTMLFSATMPKTVQHLADSLLSDPVRVEVTPAATTAERVEQQVHFLPKSDKRALLGKLLNSRDLERVLIFTRTKRTADRVAKNLLHSGIEADAIHGNKSQGARQRALKSFRSGNIRALVATDIAARGIDVDGITHVINFELPNEPESYVHRIGRTARAGASGIAISFCDQEERAYLRDIERLTKQTLTVIGDKPPAPANDDARGKSKKRQHGKSGGRPGAKSGGKSNGQSNGQNKGKSSTRPWKRRNAQRSRRAAA